MAFFPSSVATQLQLLTAINNTSVLLDVNAGIGDTTITVDDASPLSTSGYLTFNDDTDNPEVISYTGKSGNDLTGVTRGDDGTSAGAHTADGLTALEMRWNAKYHNILVDEVIAVETNLSARLGLSATQILAPLASVSAPSHGFTGDVNTGMYSSGADAIDFATGGTRALGITSAQAIQIPKTSNQLVIGTTNTTTISFTAPTASRVYTVPDAGGSASFILSAGASTLSLSTSLTVTGVTNQIILGTTNTVTINSTAPAASRVYTIPDAGSAASFVMTVGTQTISGAITHSATLTMSGATIAMGSNKITGLAAATTAGDAVRYEQLFTTGTVTFLGTIAFNPSTGGIIGTTTNDSATAGNVGEAVRTYNTPPNNFTTTTQWADGTSISLTAGDWDVEAIISVDFKDITTIVKFGISTTTGNSSTGLNLGDNMLPITPGTSILGGGCISGYRVSITTTTTHYLKVMATFTGTAPQYGCRLSARRVR